MTPMEFVARLVADESDELADVVSEVLFFPDPATATRWRDTFRAGQRHPHARLGEVEPLENGGAAVLVPWVE